MTPEEEEHERLKHRAEAIWGENPFSPENMAADAAMKDIERRTVRARERYRNMRDLEDD